MFYCFDKKLDFEYTLGEIAIAKRNSNIILYDSDLKIFTDCDGKKIDIKNQVIFPRTGSIQIYDMNNQIINQGGVTVVTNEEVKQVTSWPKYFKTLRQTTILSGRELLKESTVGEIEKKYGAEIFFKTKEKDFHDTISINLLKDPDCVFYKAILQHLDDEFIISEKVDIATDEYGLKEYRCFVVNNQLMNISRMTVNLLHTIEPEILSCAQAIVERLNGNRFPNFYCFDIFEYERFGKKEIDVVEFNPIHAAGIYLYNSVINKSEDLLHQNKKKISQEFLGQLEQCREKGLVINNRDIDYNIRNSFSNDLRSICISGDTGMVFSTMRMSKLDYGSHGYNLFKDCTEITDDDFFDGSRVDIKDGFELSDDDILKMNKLLQKEKNKII